MKSMKSVPEQDKNCSLQIRDCGITDYRQILQMQQLLRDKRQQNEIPNTVLIVEHPAVITLGARQSSNRLLINRKDLEQKQIDVVEVRRGGGTTAHNPGQLVFYPILNLQKTGLGINKYIRELESIGAELLEQLGVHSERRKGAPGLWIGERKIASIGVRVSKFITYHGMAINIQNNLSIFDYIVPCGLDNVEMTSVLKETGKEHPMKRIKQILTKILKDHFASYEQ
jgi:lipoate-protein ligase B